MLLAITRGKAGRLQLPGADTSLSWRDVFKGREDLLTGVIFGRFRFLSATALAQVMTYLIGDQGAQALGDFKGIELWPQLRKLEGRSWVEPDVLLTFDHALVLVEVKPPAGGAQSEQQWRNEILALEADDASDGVKYLHFVALGNTKRIDGEVQLSMDGAQTAMALSCHAREWDSMALAIQQLQLQAAGPDAAVFDDWRDALALFGVIPAPRRWSDLVAWSEGRSLGLIGLLPNLDLREGAARSQKCPPWSRVISMLSTTQLELPQWT